ncbi:MULTISPECIES: hypothetical protein [Streptomyces]|uniref:Uncharacterized protein n=1 Tax=Streptomyces morookaense TaxID=1970 RepID=A0A7Y7EA86_STRMO|nr:MULTISPECIES: hypothetical protein [Streptomyces]MCC2279161.1 hypothetical protein [Streptomyces sp. ET3-23]NVK81226.1 hypothetical protein [Streptomyces morookaense]GHF30391.1 hypothetical protein GCM10010359_35620 [Streptomyces morookaense]
MASPLRRTAAVLLAVSAVAGSADAAAVPAAPRRIARAGQPLEAECSARVDGSRAVADCFNANATPDRVQLHVQCARWWDPGMDTATVTVEPARHVSLAQRCWLEIRQAWVSHLPG